MHGGKRKGAGRPPGSGKFKTSSKVVRIPEYLHEAVSQFVASEGYYIPFYTSSVQAGSPFPVGEEYEPKKVNLYDFLVTHPDATFMIKASGDSMMGAGIYHGDIMVVDRILPASHDTIVIASLNGDLTVKRLYKKGGLTRLMPENPEFDPIDIGEQDSLHIFGVVTHCIHSL